MQGVRMAGSRTGMAIAGLILAAVAAIAVNVAAGTALERWRLDLTANNLYTISDGTKTVLRNLDTPVTVHLYFSDTLAAARPGLKTYHERVRSLLERYVALSDGRLTLETHDPEPFSRAEDRAVAFGLQGIPVNRAGDKGYFGLAAVNSTGNTEVIPFFDRERQAFLEYDLTKLIHSLADPEKKTVALVTALDMTGGGGGRSPLRRRHQEAWRILGRMRKFFNVKTVKPSAESLPDGVEMVMLAKPGDMTPGLAYAIDQFALRGGRVLAFVDPRTEVARKPALRTSGPGKQTRRLLEAWGVKLRKGRVAGDLKAAQRVRAQRGSRAATDYVAWLDLGRPNLDPRDVITGQLNKVLMASPGVLEPVKDAGTKVTRLIHTGDKAQAMPVKWLRGRAAPGRLLERFTPQNKQLTLAVRLRGRTGTAFPDGPPGDAKEKAGDAFVKKAQKPVNVVVAADVDMLHDRFWVRTRSLLGQELAVPRADNAAFTINALENLSGSNALIGLRARGGAEREFTLINRIRRAAERRYRAKADKLKQELESVRKRLERLRGGPGDKGALLSQKQREALDAARERMVAIREDLRRVRHALKSDIERVKTAVKAINIGGVPLGLGVIVGVTALIRRRRQA